MNIVQVVWNDACHYPDHSATIEEIVKKATTKVVIDFGILLHEDENRIILSTVAKEGKRFNKHTAIPKGMIKKIIVLKDNFNFEDYK